MNTEPAAGVLTRRLELAMRGSNRRMARLAAAGTTVCFVVTGASGEAVTLLLDRDPPLFVRGEEPAEVTIRLSATQADAVAHGKLSLPPALLAGRVAYRGPVRKYLTVDPVLRSLLAEVSD